MKEAGTLYLFTESFPFGNAEPFLETELPYLSEAFERIVIVPRRYWDGTARREVPGNVDVRTPFGRHESRGDLIRSGLLNTSPVLPMLREGIAKGGWRSWRRFSKWLEATLLARRMLADRTIRRILEDPEPGSLIYFFWGSGPAWVLPFVNPGKPCVSRFHGFDLYEEEQNNQSYIPFREAYLRKLSAAIFVSRHGKNYLASKYPEVPVPSHVFPTGVKEAGRSPAGPGDVLRIVSCARMVAIKRIGMIVETLQRLSCRVEWTHIGDGPLRGPLEQAAETLPQNVTAVFKGALPNDELLALYAGTPCDLFIHLSETEGAPVSVMEALAAGIPVFATDVGGTSELVDESCGRLFPEDVDPEEIARAVEALAVDPQLRRRLADGARTRWETSFRAEVNYPEFAQFLAACAR